jgi:DNA-directed RNA polymerase specialized sigma24 family protein
MRMIVLRDRDWANRAHFFSVASHISMLAPGSGGDKRGLDLLDLHEALSELEKASPRTSKILELQVFGGLTVTEIAAALDLSAATANRELRIGKAWLHDFIHHGRRL